VTGPRLVPPVGFTGEVHPYADSWPMSAPEDVEALAASIAANGQRFPIVLDPGGCLVDGRNRLAACTIAGVEPWFVVDESLTTQDAIVALIWDVNGERRDVSKGQKAMLAALRPGPERFLSKQAGVTNGYVAKARQVVQWCGADVVAAVCAGTMPLNDAYDLARRTKDTEQAEVVAARKAAARLDTLRGNAPDFADLVDTERMTIAEAEAAWAERTRKDRERAAVLADGIQRANVAVTEAIYRLHLLNLHPNGVTDWLATYNPAHPIHPLNGTEIRHAINALTTLEAAQ
jgi:hypothetical protein